jgi:hypothetical protein
MSLLGVPVLVAALAMRPPIHIATCDISAPSPALNIGTDGVPTPSGGNELHVRFSNDGNQPITRIVFALNGGSTVVDAGTFAPGATIDHRFDVVPSEADSCSVESATYADGTEWNAH